MRCQDCNKFVSQEVTDDPEVEVEIDEDGKITGSVRLVLLCTECSGELKESNQDFEMEPSPELTKHLEEMHTTPEDEVEPPVLSVEGTAEMDDYFVTTTRTGKPITNPRYQKHMYTASVQLEIECSCGKTFTAEAQVEEAAGSFDEL